VSGCYQSYPRIDLDEVCEPEPFEAIRVDPGIYIVLDRSRSMCYPYCPDDMTWNYWTPAVEGISSIVTELEQEVAFGLALFPDPDGDDDSPNCDGPSSSWSVPVRLDNAPAITTLLTEAPWPHGGTPTAPALNTGVEALGPYIGFRTASVLLVTDGAPNCNDTLDVATCTCSSPDPPCTGSTQCLDDVRTYAAIRRLHDEHGVQVHVMGLVGAGGWEWIPVMNTMAELGGTSEAVLVEDPDDVAPVLEEFGRLIVPCYFDVDPDDLVDPDATVFDVEGISYSRDTARLSGWDLVETDRIRFFGTPCDTILETGITTVTGHVPCE
jgi:hypothetical protein